MKKKRAQKSRSARLTHLGCEGDDCNHEALLVRLHEGWGGCHSHTHVRKKTQPITCQGACTWPQEATAAAAALTRRMHGLFRIAAPHNSQMAACTRQQQGATQPNPIATVLRWIPAVHSVQCLVALMPDRHCGSAPAAPPFTSITNTPTHPQTHTPTQWHTPTHPPTSMMRALGSSSRDLSGWFRPMVSRPSQEPMFLRRERSSEDERMKWELRSTWGLGVKGEGEGGSGWANRQRNKGAG